MNKFYMAGTEGTGLYVVVAATALGRVGFRPLDNGQTRVRVEPSDDGSAEAMAEQFGHGWKQPDDHQLRFSLVTEGETATAQALSVGLKAIGATVAEGVEVNASAPDWAKALVASPVQAPPEPELEEEILLGPTSSEEEVEKLADKFRGLIDEAAELAKKLLNK